MDRFIACRCRILLILQTDLKSNMDRFIDNEIEEKNSVSRLFKIQYG